MCVRHRYAMSVMWELDARSLAVRDVWFGRTLIRSSYQLHYELAQALLTGEQAEVPELARLEPEVKDVKLAELTQALEMLTYVARHLRAQRDRGGALELEGVEVGLRGSGTAEMRWPFELTPSCCSRTLLRCAPSWTRRGTSRRWFPASLWRSTRRWRSA